MVVSVMYVDTQWLTNLAIPSEFTPYPSLADLHTACAIRITVVRIVTAISQIAFGNTSPAVTDKQRELEAFLSVSCHELASANQSAAGYRRCFNTAVSLI